MKYLYHGLAVLFLVIAAVNADVIRFKDGTMIDGEITGRSGKGVMLRERNGKVNFYAHRDIDEIIEGMSLKRKPPKKAPTAALPPPPPIMADDAPGSGPEPEIVPASQLGIEPTEVFEPGYAYPSDLTAAELGGGDLFQAMISGSVGLMVCMLFGMIASCLSSGAHIFLLVRAFQDSVGKGFLCLCIPFFILYYGLAQYEGPGKGPAISIWILGLLVSWACFGLGPRFLM